MKSCLFPGRPFSRTFFWLLLASPFGYAAPAPLTQDAFINGISSQANNTLGRRALIRVSSEEPRQGLLQFDLSGIEGNVTSAVLTFSVAKVTTQGNLGLHTVLSSWNENTVTFNSAPGFNPAPVNSTSIAPDDVGGTVSVDVSSAAQAWINNPGSNHGFALLSQGVSVEIRSKEGGGGATLEVVTGGPGSSANMVVVAPEGGDYTNPLDAVDNALEGDQWCSSSCVILVRAGEYVIDRTLNLIPMDNFPITLVGEGSDATIIRSAPDVDIAIVAADLESLRLIHTAPFNGEKIGWTSTFEELAGRDLRIAVSGGTANYGVRGPGEFRELIMLTDVSISVVGGEATGIHGRGVSLENVDIVANGGMATGILNFDEHGPGLEVEESDITAQGVSAAAIRSSGEHATISDSVLRAFGSSATGLSVSGFHVALKLYSSTVEADPSVSGSIGVSGIPEGGFDHFEIYQSRISGNTAVLLRDEGGEALFRIDHSTLDGLERALALQNFGRLRIDNSSLVAPVAIDAQSGFNVQIGVSKLDGIVNPGTSSLTCVYVYDGVYDALDESCQ